ncbi:MAG TPA: hypothetical protein VN862_05345 [Candidatus Acidoferrales bacterium]|nr:hypothetical protein [Candidatus Acidoferrales bacterium]
MACPEHEEKLNEAALLATSGARDVSNAVARVDEILARHLAGCGSCRVTFDQRRAFLAEMDRGVTSLVSAQPSAALIPRVRQEIAAVSVSRDKNRWQWTGAGIVVTAAAALAIFFVTRPNIRKQSRPISGALSNASQPLKASPKLAPENIMAHTSNSVAAPTYGRTERRQRHVSLREAAKSILPPSPTFEIIVPPGQREAVLRFAQAMREYSIDEAQLIAASNEEVTGPAPLALAPLSITLLNEPKESTGDAAKGNAPIK